MRMVALEALAEALGGKLAGGVAREPERFGDRPAEERIAERAEDEGERILGDAMLIVADAEVADEAADRIEDRIERVTVAGEDHPGGKSPRAFAVEHVEGAVDDLARVDFAGTRPLDRLGDGRSDRIGDGSGKLALETGRRPEMVEEVGMGSADLGRDRFQSDGLGAVGQQQAARGFDRGGPAFFRAQSFAPC